MIRIERCTSSFAALALLSAGLSLAACDDDDDGGSDHDAATEEDAATSEPDAGDDDGGDEMDAEVEDASGEDDASHGNDAGHAEDADAGAPPSCAAYCGAIQANCSGANAQYASMAVCMAVCGSFPVGMLGDTAGNTLGCRQYHAGAAAGSGATTHCHHAGITGGDLDPSDTAGGPCGEGCDAFCNEALLACTAATTPGGTAPYATKEACLTECKMFPASTSNFSTAATSGNTFHCRAYHLSAASTAPAPHCGHIKLSSPTCM